MRHYTTQQLGPNREKTPEGFLLCRNVPIARTGMQLYGAHEVPVSDGGTGRVQIHRRPEDVFRNITMESFNGKPVTLDHPGQDVTPDNWKDFAVGFVLDTRRGQGMEDDLLLADMMITDSGAIKRVLEDGIAEISCGYDAEYEEEAPGVGYQVSILGNHVALVEAGRCGSRCSIRDSEGEMTLREKIMAAFSSKDETALKTALDALPTPGTDETHIHIHAATNDSINPVVSGRASVKDEKEEKETKDEVVPSTSDSNAAVLAAIAALDTKVTSVSDRLTKIETRDAAAVDKDDDDEEESTKDAATGDEKEEDSQESEEIAAERASHGAVTPGIGDATREHKEPVTPTGDAAVKDSRYLEQAISNTLAAAEILSPGIGFPAFDSADAATKTSATLDTLRRKSLMLASSTPIGAACIAELRGGHPLTAKGLKKMTAKDVRTLFYAASGHMKMHNRSQHDKAATVSVPRTGPITIAEINRRNREFWGEKVS